MARLSELTRWTIVSKHEEGKTIDEIANETGIERHSVSRWINRYDETESVDDLQRSGRHRKRTRAVSRAIVQISEGKIRKSTRFVERQLRRRRIADIGHETVRAELMERGLHPFHRKRKLKLRRGDKARRIRFANDNMDRDWSNVLFSNLKKWQMGGYRNPKNEIVWARSTHEVPPFEVTPFPLSRTMWGAISSQGKTRLYWYEGKVDTDTYIDILETTLLPMTQEAFPNNDFILQQDHDRAHTSQRTMRWFEDNNVEIIPPEDWPLRSPDLTPIENVFAILEERVSMRRYRTFEGYIRCIEDEWARLSQATINNIINAIPERLRAVRRARGGHIN